MNERTNVLEKEGIHSVYRYLVILVGVEAVNSFKEREEGRKEGNVWVEMSSFESSLKMVRKIRKVALLSPRVRRHDGHKFPSSEYRKNCICI